MWKVILRIICGVIAITILGILFITDSPKIGNLKANEYFYYVLVTLVLVAWAVLFALVATRRYPGDLASFLSWLVFFPIAADITDRFNKHGAGYLHFEILGAYVVLVFTLVVIASETISPLSKG